MIKSDTIAAIASAVSPSGIGIIRISGPEAINIADRILRFKNSNKSLSSCQTHTIHYGMVYDGDLYIDEVLVLLMKGPHSYTAEDTVEIDCHGGVYVMKRVLEAVVSAGARVAEPGEFTKRAFLNGRIDLSQAESVIDVINSKNQFALESSLSQLKGRVKDDISQIRQEILHEIAFIESALDDPEHISLEGYPQKLDSIVSGLKSQISSMLALSENGRMRKEGIQTVILGKPNAGKSSLLNRLIGEDKAIVTDIAGTTRDVLEEQITLNGISLNLMDTAGIRKSSDLVEQIGVMRARNLAEKADLILFVVDCSTPLDQNDLDILSFIQDKRAIVLLNKSDLYQVLSIIDLKNMTSAPVISISAKDGDGIDELADYISQTFFQGKLKFNDQVYITNIRQKDLLAESLNSLDLVSQSIASGMAEDFFSIDLMNAYQSLGQIIGESLEDDLAQEIFSKFCMGK